MSARIDLNGQGYTTGSTPDGTIKIDRTFPGLLHGQMSDTEWTNFCDRVDQTLEPVAGMKSNMKKALCYYIGASMVAVALFSVLSATGVFMRIGFGYYYIIFPMFVLPFIGFYYRGVRPMGKKIRDVLEELKQLCLDESGKRSNVSFHVRDEIIRSNDSNVVINYIECSVGNASGVTVTPGVTVTAEPVATSLFDRIAGGNSASYNHTTQGHKSVADRLKDLEELKSILTKKEYDQKRQEILAEV